mgnify:CR=1 FL=1
MQYTKHYDIPEEIRRGVIKTLTPISQIKDELLRNQVADAWTISLAMNGYTSLDQLPGNGNPDGPEIGTQVMHINGVAKIALTLKREIEDVTGKPLGVDEDLLIASALCHDIGKPYESAPENRRRWETDSKVSGLPALRHPMAGASICKLLDMPEVVVHTAGCHSPEGRFVVRSLITTIVNRADEGYWRIIERANDIEVKLM